MILLSDLKIENEVLVEDVKVDSNWIYSQKLLDKFAEEKSLYITQDLYFRRIVDEPRTKMLKDILPMKGVEKSGLEFEYSDNLFNDGWGTNEDGFDEIHNLLGEQSLMSFPKPSKLIAKLVLSVTRENKDSIILDFFAGSSTTAHAVMQLNAEDGGNRQFIMVQIPEATDSKSEAFKAGYPTIAEISKERIRRAGAKIKTDNADKDGINELDTGFRVLKIDTTNMADIYYRPEDYSQDLLGSLENNIKPDRTDEDLLFQFMLDTGIPLSLPIERSNVGGHTIYQVGGNSLIASLDHIDANMISEIAKMNPLKFITSERAIATDSDKTNIKERFKQLSPHTDVRFI